MTVGRKTRLVEIPESRELDSKTFDELYKHAKNSAVWYATNFIRCENQVRRRLLDKGFIKDDITVFRKRGDETVSERVNIIDGVIDELHQLHLADDDLYVAHVVSSMTSGGKSSSRIRQRLRQDGVAEKLIDGYLSDVEEESVIREVIEKIGRKSTVSKITDPEKKRRKLMTSLASRGFSPTDIIREVDIYLSDDE